jgi:hypothetical protein
MSASLNDIEHNQARHPIRDFFARFPCHASAFTHHA